MNRSTTDTTEATGKLTDIRLMLDEARAAIPQDSAFDVGRWRIDAIKGDVLRCIRSLEKMERLLGEKT